MVSNRLQFRHHLEIFTSRDEALSYLAGLVDNSLGNAPIGESKMGEPLVVAYKNGDEDKVSHLILAIGKSEGGTGVEYHYIDSDNMESAIQSAEEMLEKHEESINKLREDVDTISGSMISKITVNGKEAEITNGEATVTINGADILIDGYVKADDPKDAVHPEDSINKAIGKLESKSDNNDERLKELEKVHPDDITIGSTDKDGNIFLGTLLKVNKIENPVGSNIETIYELVDALGHRLGEQIVVKKDSHLINAELVKNETTGIASVLRLTYLDESHTERIIDIDIKDFLQEAEFKDGLKVQNGEVSVKRDENSEAFLSVSPDGVKVSGIQNAIDTAVETEKNRAIAEEDGIKQNLTDADTRLTSKIDKVSADTHAEIDRINTEMQADANNLASEIQRAQNEEVRIETLIGTKVAEEASRVDALMQADADNLVAETQRAQNEEARIETLIGTKIDTEVLERNDAIAVSLQESKEYADNLVGDLSYEVAANKVSVSAPLTIAESTTGTTLGMKITEGSKILNIEDNGLKATVGISYDEDNSRIILTGIDGQELSSIDARRFIKDGMLDDVSVVTENNVKYIVFTFNTESGKDVIRFAVEEIFQPYKGSDGIAISADNAIVLKIDNSGDGKYLKLTSDGLGLQNITSTVDAAIADVNNTVALIEQRVSDNEQILDNLDDVVNSKMANAIHASMIANVVTEITPAEAENQTLIRRVGDQYYVDNTTRFIYHKGESLESTIDDISGKVIENSEKIAVAESEIEAIKVQNATITADIDALKAQNATIMQDLNDVKNLVESLKNTLDGMMKIKSLAGTSDEIKVTNTDGNIVIGFDDNAIFGQV